jgi:hypothetical protein
MWFMEDRGRSAERCLSGASDSAQAQVARQREGAWRRAETKKKARRIDDAPSNKRRLATACWDFIVAKSTPPQPAPMLVFRPLRGPNIKSYPHNMNRLVARFVAPWSKPVLTDVARAWDR